MGIISQRSNAGILSHRNTNSFSQFFTLLKRWTLTMSFTPLAPVLSTVLCTLARKFRSTPCRHEPRLVSQTRPAGATALPPNDREMGLQISRSILLHRDRNETSGLSRCLL
jgi:hypothetical protein